jgi:hypothetical protein
MLSITQQPVQAPHNSQRRCPIGRELLAAERRFRSRILGDNSVSLRSAQAALLLVRRRHDHENRCETCAGAVGQ